MRRHIYFVLMAALCCLLSFNLHTQTIWNNTSGDFKWFNPVNWSNGLPANGNDATILFPAQVEVDLPSNQVFDFNIFSQGTVNINLNGFSLDLNGSFDNNGPAIFNLMNTDGQLLISGNFDNSAQAFFSGTAEITNTGILKNIGFLTLAGVLTTHNKINNTNGIASNTSCAILNAMPGSIFSGGVFNQNGILYQIDNAIVQVTSGVGINLNDLNENPAPAANCSIVPIIRNLDANGMTNINTGDVNDLSNADYCPNNVDFLTLSKMNFNCNDVGSNTVTLTVKDGFGFTSFCEATVEIQDNSLPFIQCPGPMSFNLLPGECEIQVNFGGLSAIDNCGNLDIDQIDNSGLSSGDDFPIGITQIEFRVTDVGGNTDECSFSVTVNEFEPPSTGLTCNELLNISLDNDCEAIITPDMVLEGSYGCYDYFEVEVDQTGDNFVDFAYVNQTVTLTVTNLETGNSCWGEGLVEDKLPPQIIESCQDTILNCLMNTDPITLGGDVSIPLFEDCSFFDIYFVDEETSGDCNLPFMTQVLRTWTATDENGRINSCQQTITVESISIAANTVTCPDDYEFECDANMALDFSPEETGYPTVDIDGTLYEIKNTAGAPCGLTAAYTDVDSISKCGIGYRIVRRWTIVDWCAPFDYVTNPQECFQVLDFVDHENPEIITPSNVILNANTDDCVSTGIIPPAVINDCSNAEVVTITTIGPIQGNGGQIPFPGLEVGEHEIIYRATDDCGNTTDSSIVISIVDDVLPNPICKTFTVVSVNETGFGAVYFYSFDNGGYDNCCLDSVLVRRMTDNCGVPANLEFGEILEFCCEDVGIPQAVEVKYVDCNGNSNTCMVETEVQDKIDPTIECPADLTMECEEDFTDLAVTGEATGTDNCGIVTINFEDEIDLNCGVGLVTRTWIAEDMGGTSLTCIQEITIENSNPFDGSEIMWPDDTEFESCDSIPAGADTGEPNLPMTGICADLAVSFIDEVFDGSNGDYCKKIHRSWTVIDWCQFEPNNPATGRWQYVQIIKLQDNVGPVISNCNNAIFCNFKSDCEPLGVNLSVDAMDNCTADNLLTFSWIVDLNNDNVVDNGAEFSGNGQNLGNEYPNGVHEITFSAADDCGNTTNCSFLFTIEDCKKPTIACDGLIVENMQGGEITVTANQFINTSLTADNCTEFSGLVISFSPDLNDTDKTFTCDNLGENEVEIWVTDEAGNQDLCITSLILQDNMNECSDGLVFNLGGQIQNETNDGVEEVMVEISGDNYFMNYTDVAGAFEISDVPSGEDYLINPNLDADPTNGVTTFDILLMAWHILGTKPLETPYQLIAADVNNSGSVTTFDIISLRKVILHIHDNFPNNTSWRFVDSAYEFPNPLNPLNPFTEPFPEFINVDNLNGDNMNMNFVAVKIGDLNGTAVANNLLVADDRTVGKWTIQTKNHLVEAGERVSLDFIGKDFDKIEGYQFTLNFDADALQFIQLQPGDDHLLNNFGLHLIEEGALTVSWDKLTAGQINNTLSTLNKALFNLTFIAKKDGELKDLIHLNSRFTAAESYYENGEIFAPSIEFSEENGVAVASNSFELYQNLPNPFGDATIIGFNLPEAAGATLTILDTNGRVLKIYENFFHAGYNEIEVLAKDLPIKGVLFYQLETDTDIAFKKMIKQ